MREEVLRMHDVTLIDQGSVQLEDFSLSVFGGEIVGVLPINGHGVSAMIDLLQNNLPLQTGYVYYREEPINCWHTPGQRINRIGVIKNASSLVENMTVADNIFVLRPGFRLWLIPSRLLVRQLQPVLDDLGIHIEADAYVDTLSSFEKVVVELVKAIVAGSRLIILREISSMISDQELTRLHGIMRHYASEGVSFLYIGFHYEELVQICDRTAIYSNGRILRYFTPSDGELLYKEQYVRRVREQIIHQEQKYPARCALDIRNLSGGKVRRLSLSVMEGECIVLQDLQNLIFDDLIDLLTGVRPIEAGQVSIDHRDCRLGSSRDLAILRERPDISMVFPELSYLDNLCMTVDHRLERIWTNKRIQSGLRREWARHVGDEVFDLRIGALSRKQRYALVFQRILLQRPKVVICHQPFQGADIDMRMYIWEWLKNLVNQGIAVVILAVNLADSLTLATRLVRVEKGRMQVYERSEFDQLPFNAPWLQLYKDIPQMKNEKQYGQEDRFCENKLGRER